MSSTRESVYTRRRSNTATSLRGPALAATVQFGDSITLVAWVHTDGNPSTVLLNFAAWPGIGEGDLVELTCRGRKASDDVSFVFTVKDVEDARRPRQQISIPKKMADRYNIAHHTEVLCTKVNPRDHTADYIECSFKDQYLGRSDMWRFVQFLNGQCVQVAEEITVPGVVSATVESIFTKSKKVHA